MNKEKVLKKLKEILRQFETSVDEGIGEYACMDAKVIGHVKKQKG